MSDRNPWKDAIIDAAVVGWIYTAEHETDPHKAVNDLLCWERKMALDPAISKEARDLVQRAEHAEAALDLEKQEVAHWKALLTEAQRARDEATRDRDSWKAMQKDARDAHERCMACLAAAEGRIAKAVDYLKQCDDERVVRRVLTLLTGE